MAYDKVVDSSVLDAGLKQIADAIREKAGTSGNLAFPAAMAEAIAAIEAGGGGNVNAFLRTFAEDTKLEWLTIDHNSGFVPTFIAVVRTGSATLGEYELGASIQCFDSIGVNSLYAGAATLSSGTSKSSGFSESNKFDSAINNETETKLYFYSSSTKMKAGVPYLFLFAGVEV